MINRVQAKIERISQLLSDVYGDHPLPQNHRHDALDVLVETILSQNTSDQNSERVFERVRAKYPDWKSVLKAPTSELERVLKPGGLAHTKSRVIKHVLSEISRKGDLSLDYLKKMTDTEAEQHLLAFRGVGYKTARCVLLFALGRDVFPIDTHIYRILIRTGVLSSTVTREKAHEIVAPLIPRGKSYALHVNLIRLGREVCRPREPKCPQCPLRSLCFFAHSAKSTAKK